MKFIHLKIILSACAIAFSAAFCLAQEGSSRPSQQDEEEKKVQFYGLGRSILSNTMIGGDLLDMDTTTAVKLTDGEFLLDLAINAQPNANTEVQGILRLRNEFGGFFGAGVSVEIRELWARGVIGNALQYRVGDFDHVITPYTFYNPDEEGMVNEPTIFQMQKDVVYYEQWYTEGNKRRLQGAKLDLGLEFPMLLDEVEITPFVARVRGTDYLSIPTRFTGGGRIGASTQVLQDSLGLLAKVGLNLSHTWDDLKSGDANSGIRNLVWSVDYDVTAFDKDQLEIHLLGEVGRSSLKFITDDASAFDEDDSFLEAGVTVRFKPSNLTVSATFVDLGPDFFSTAAQSKRVDFNREKSFFNRIGNNRQIRMPTLFDLSRDRALYSFELSDKLLPYDPRYANVMPYGKATPNRTGVQFALQFIEKKQKFDAGVEVALLKEIRGQGTFELKDFMQIRAHANINIHNMFDMDKILVVTLGLQNESTQRDGIDVDQLDFTSTLLEVGVEVELFARFDLLGGVKFLTASGKDYVPLIEKFNDIKDFPAPYLVDDTESLIAAGLRYRFKEDVHFSMQYQHFSLSQKLNPLNDYTLGQVFALYSMEF